MDTKDAVYDYIVDNLLEIFKSECLAEAWLNTPNRDLKNRTPMSTLKGDNPNELLTYVEGLKHRHIVQ